MNRRVEVRCCCDPARLIGFIDVPDDVTLRDGTIVPFQLEGVDAAITLQIATWSYPSTRYGDPWGYDDDLAFKSDDTPIETLRRIPGFVEASREDVARDIDRLFAAAVPEFLRGLNK